jgi:hypothetical protein
MIPFEAGDPVKAMIGSPMFERQLMIYFNENSGFFCYFR